MLLRKNTAEVEAKGTEQNLPHVLFAGKDTCHYDKIRIVSDADIFLFTVFCKEF